MDMEEKIWTGSPSQIVNFGTYILCIIVFLLLFPITYYLGQLGLVDPKTTTGLVVLGALILSPAVIMLIKRFEIKTTIYDVTTERILLTKGILSKHTEIIELYHVRDMALEQPFFLRLFGLENIRIISTDLSMPEMVIRAVPSKLGLFDSIRSLVNKQRSFRGVREMNVVNIGDYRDVENDY